MELTLSKLPMLIDAIVLSNPNQRQVDLGLGAGTRVRIISRAAFNGPIAVRFETSCFAFRPDELDNVYVEIVQ